MNLRNQRRISSKILNAGQHRVWIDPQRLAEVKEAITRADLVALIKSGAIQKRPENGHSKGRTRKHKLQKRKGRQRNIGSRKGKSGARRPKKQTWIATIRQQRAFLKRLISKKLITTAVYHEMYRKTKGGFFRSLRHLKGYLTDHELIAKKNK